MTPIARFVVVSGIPGSGKSTLGRALAEHLGLPYLGKDAMLEALFDDVQCSDEETRHRLSREADRAFERVARSHSRAVLDSFWRHSRDDTDSGTPSAWLTVPEIHAVEVFCSCDPELAATRFLNRRRHHGHIDTAWDHASLVAQSRRLLNMLPLGVGTLIRLDTTNSFDTTSLAERVRIALDA